jgi:hypothetical protein
VTPALVEVFSPSVPMEHLLCAAFCLGLGRMGHALPSLGENLT